MSSVGTVKRNVLAGMLIAQALLVRDESCQAIILHLLIIGHELIQMHLKGIKCSYQFCWNCLANYKTILMTDNSAHHADCIFHTNNLSE